MRKTFSQIRKGDFLVVYKLDHSGRSLKHLLEFVTILNEKQIGLHQSISNAIDTRGSPIKKILTRLHQRVNWYFM